MRILFTRFPLESSYGGAEVQTLSLLKGLRERGHAVAFLGSCPTLLRLCKEEGIPAAELDIGPPPVTKWSAVSFLWRKRRMEAMLQGALEELPVQAIVMLSMTEKILLTPLAAARGIRVLWVEHDRVGRWLTRNPWLPALKKASAQAAVVTVSDLSRKIYVDELGFDPARVVVIGNGVDPKRLAGGAPFPRPPCALHVGTVDRLSRDKGVDLLIDAVSDLPDVALSIAKTGDFGPEETSLHAQARRIDPEGKRIRFVDVKDRIGAFYRSLDVFVLPSRLHDPCPLAPMEALWEGIPVILTEVCGTAGFLAAGREVSVVPAGSAPALRQALEQLKNPQQRVQSASAGQRAAREKFSLKRMVEEYESILRAT